MRTSAAQRVSLIIAAFVVTAMVAAQGAWPERPVQLIVPFPAAAALT